MNKHTRESLHDVLVFSSRDWAADASLAWVYGVIVGWDEPSFREFEAKGFWTPLASTKLQKLNKDFWKDN